MIWDALYTNYTNSRFLIFWICFNNSVGNLRKVKSLHFDVEAYHKVLIQLLISDSNLIETNYLEPWEIAKQWRTWNFEHRYPQTEAGFR